MHIKKIIVSSLLITSYVHASDAEKKQTESSVSPSFWATRRIFSYDLSTEIGSELVQQATIIVDKKTPIALRIIIRQWDSGRFHDPALPTMRHVQQKKDSDAVEISRSEENAKLLMQYLIEAKPTKLEDHAKQYAPLWELVDQLGSQEIPVNMVKKFFDAK